MYTCSDIQNIAKYISQSGTDIKQNSGKKNFFVPFFVDQTTDSFKKSVVISSAYLDLSNQLNKNSNMFKVNTAIPRLLEKTIGISSSDYMYKCYDINNQKNNTDISGIDYSYLSKNLDELFLKKDV